MRNIETDQATAIAARGGTPILLVELVQNVPGIARTYRWASRQVGATDYGYALSGNTYRADMAELPRFHMAMTPRGGVSEFAAGQLVLVNPSEAGVLWTDALDDGALDGGILSFYLIFINADSSEIEADRILLGKADIRHTAYSAGRIMLDWASTAVNKYRPFPQAEFNIVDYPYAPVGRWGRVKPVVLGDMTGQLFDVATTPTSGIRRHVPAPLSDGMRQRYYLFDIAAASAQEEIVEIDGVHCTIPSASLTLASDYIQIDDFRVDPWIPPVRIDATTDCTDPANVQSEDLEAWATVANAKTLRVDFPGLRDSMGAYSASGTPAAADCIVYFVHSTASGTGSIDVTVYDGADVIAVQQNYAPTATRATGYTNDGTLGEIGTSFAVLSDILSLNILIEGVGGVATRIHRIVCKIQVRSTSMLEAWRENRVFRSQRGFIESTGVASDDYMDAGYIDPPGATERATMLTSPADQLEALLRNKNWGLSLRAPTYTDYTLALSTYYGSETALILDADIAGQLVVGDVVLIAQELMLITAVNDTTETITVTRGYGGSRQTMHATAESVYKVGTGGQVDIGAFRAAVNLLKFPSGTELILNGAMEGTYSSGVAPSWSEYDPNTKGTPASATGFERRYGQSVVRTADTGENPGVVTSAAITTVSGSWYILRGYIKGSAADTATVTIGTGTGGPPPTGMGNTATWDVPVTTSWARFEIVYKAWTTSTFIWLTTPTTGTTTVIFDEVSFQLLSDWSWDHVITDEQDARAYLDEACIEAGHLRLIEDSTGRTAPRIQSPYRYASERETWTASDIVIGPDGGPLLSVSQTDLDSVHTGVEVRYAYDYILGDFRGLTYVVAELESTGQAVTSDDGSTIVVPSTAAIYPTSRWDARAFQNVTTSGTDNKTLTFTDGLGGGNVPAFQTSGVASGDWILWWRAGLNIMQMTRIASVDSETAVTVTEPMMLDANVAITNFIAAFPHVYRAGGLIFLPIVTSGPGSQHATDITYYGGGRLDDRIFGEQSTSTAGDIVYRLKSDSDDGTGTRDQTDMVYNDRERWAMARVAKYGKVNTLQLSAPRIQDRATAVELRNRVFDYHQRCYMFNVATDLHTISREIGDQIVLTHDMVPGSSMVTEIISQDIDVPSGLIHYMLKEVKQP